MDAINFEVVLGKVREYVAPLGFEEKENSCFAKEDLCFTVVYDEASKTFNLLCKEGEDEKKISAWLFDESHRKKDAEVIGEDFCDCIRSKLGIKKERPATTADIALPKSGKKDGAMTMDQFTQRFLAVYPQYKDDYKENVAANGGFLPVEFYRTRGAEKLRELAEGGNKKQLDKMLSMLNEFYCQGDRQVSDTVMALFFGGAFCKNKELFNSVVENMADYPFLKSGAVEIVNVAAKNKKFQAIFE